MGCVSGSSQGTPPPHGSSLDLSLFLSLVLGRRTSFGTSCFDETRGSRASERARRALRVRSSREDRTGSRTIEERSRRRTCRGRRRSIVSLGSRRDRVRRREDEERLDGGRKDLLPYSIRDSRWDPLGSICLAFASRGALEGTMREDSSVDVSKSSYPESVRIGTDASKTALFLDTRERDPIDERCGVREKLTVGMDRDSRTRQGVGRSTRLRGRQLGRIHSLHGSLGLRILPAILAGRIEAGYRHGRLQSADIPNRHREEDPQSGRTHGDRDEPGLDETETSSGNRSILYVLIGQDGEALDELQAQGGPA